MSARHRMAWLLLCWLVLCSVGVACAAADVIGYANHDFQPGLNLFTNPVDATSNWLSTIIAAPPEGTKVWLWDAAAQAYGPASTFAAGTAWDTDLLLPPGTGVWLDAPSAFTVTFVGSVLNPDGSPFDEALPLPPAFLPPPGLYLLGCKCPLALNPASGHPVFPYVVGRDPFEGETFHAWDVVAQDYVSTTFESGAWNNGDPTLDAMEAAFFQLTPEPATLALLALGGLGVFLRRRGR